MSIYFVASFVLVREWYFYVSEIEIEVDFEFDFVEGY